MRQSNTVHNNPAPTEPTTADVRTLLMFNPFANPWIQLLGIPVILCLVGMYARRLGRRDGDDSPRRNDWAIATTLLFMTFGIVVSDIRQAPAGTDVSAMLTWLLFTLVAIFVSVDVDRTHSWEVDEQGVKTTTKRLGRGIILPDVMSLALYCVYQSQKG
ncbi:MAG TPA: hypothetical protein VK358_05240 [Longimicrobium sp.]|nr:hypothetical protein [Longimicrobium sp.]